MHFVFYKTNDVFLAEEKLLAAGIHVDVVPTPVQDKAYCGVSVQIKKEDIEKAETILSELEYNLV